MMYDSIKLALESVQFFASAASRLPPLFVIVRKEMRFSLLYKPTNINLAVRTAHLLICRRARFLPTLCYKDVVLDAVLLL